MPTHDKNTAKQLNFFDQLDAPADLTLEVEIYKRDTYYEALLCGGWMRETGKTKKDALEKLKKRYIKHRAKQGFYTEITIKDNE